MNITQPFSTFYCLIYEKALGGGFIKLLCNILKSIQKAFSKLFSEERQQILAKRHNPREYYRNYSPTKYPYFLLVLLDIILTFLTVVFLLFQLSVPALVIFSFCCWSDLLTKTVIFCICITLLLSKLLRAPIKRIGFILKLKRICKKGRYSLEFKNISPKTLFSFSNQVDIKLKTDNKTYELMFMPSIKRLTILIFEKYGEVRIVTGFLRNRIKDALGLTMREKCKKYGFNGSKDSEKILLLNPVPFEIYSLDLYQKKLIPSGSGDKIFEYTLHTGSSFIREIEKRG